MTKVIGSSLGNDIIELIYNYGVLEIYYIIALIKETELDLTVSFKFNLLIYFIEIMIKIWSYV